MKVDVHLCAQIKTDTSRGTTSGKRRYSKASVFLLLLQHSMVQSGLFS
jgi:hypothetical protein